jgi:ADP-ribose pyrophosphatase YjhB (NUDIX family)
MKTHIQNIEHDRNKAAHVLLFAEDTSSILAVYPTKALARPHKRDPSKVTKGSKKPWKLPGDKRAVGEALHEAAARGLREKTGLALAKLGATLLASDTVFIGKDAVLLYSVPTELPVTAGDGVHDAQWMPCQGRRLTSVASFPLIATLKLLSGPRWSFDHNENMLRLCDDGGRKRVLPMIDPAEMAERHRKRRTVHGQLAAARASAGRGL